MYMYKYLKLFYRPFLDPKSLYSLSGWLKSRSKRCMIKFVNVKCCHSFRNWYIYVYHW